RERFDVAVARAVASLPVLMELLLPFVQIGGKCVCFKGPSVALELAAGKAAAETLGGGRPEVLAMNVAYLPQQRHCLVLSEKRRRTPDPYPRKAGTPAKNPLSGQ
ncbi:MAG: RsmG family class I SAM-dependent methyltransferase, partial [Bacillota bacterium]